MMTMVEIAALENGAHRNQTGDIDTVPDGWIEVPDSLQAAYAAAVPFMDLTVADGILTAITAREKPAVPADTTPTIQERLAASEQAILGLMGVS